MRGKDIVVVGASTGGIEALKALAEGLPRDFRASIFIVLHTRRKAGDLQQGADQVRQVVMKHSRRNGNRVGLT
jgi:chemotaxis response regulator CheB